ncbi:hypothetical protein CW745_12460 [Psychromonas sp. psych-6C06]|uniref:hypothetical protein n=1 Tax=Psychromonas sp. psych-6C06 TaxID=2058089 RepID=UPI000C32AF1F|nr:hypothetical protein [Psychromonas sp. psych-6C06]PKF61111.1 hypothetical protein CW745_12460 [Psychromonas sp. psych-6C06]
MDMSVVGSVMSHQAKVNTLEKVNVHLMKTNNEQTEQQTMQLLQSVAPVESPDGKGKHIDIQV